MDRDAILAKVIEVTEDTLSLGDDVTLTEDTNLKELGADSFDLLELVTSLEDEFSVTFSDDAVNQIPTVGAVVDAIQRAQQ
ncbi:acyl carrier protein [Olsenella profusa]|uniref:Acyl carrier protein n=1 Tax=Olsenella profusa TaxID=138595 RepID=A0ABS2F1B5_9ACTN|nr:acyl carrier protein [Olsenella profusa]MBM6774779.1 acyl carrier protein [Olsenella profusa]